MHNNRVKVSYDYDNFYRTSKKVLLNTGYALNTAYSWRQGTDSNHTSYMPSGQTETLKDASNNTVATTSLSYTYDVLGNIETVSEGGIQRQKYYYDSLNQLIREDNLDLNKTIVYSYDLGGNITSTAEYAYQTGATVTGTPTITNSYTYSDSNWKDNLTAYNGNSISYDAIGNPLSYYNGFSFTWQKGRQLVTASNGSATVTYTYNNDGYRTSKTVNGTTTDYTLEGSKVLIEKTGSDYVWYYYDAAGAPVAMATGSGPSLYIYRKNLQGDITGIYSGTTGTLLVSYVYDAWGKVTATNVAGTTESATVLARNPYLYRGYRYDAETGLYYLNSRYYDPETGRFINADGTVSTEQGILSANMFAYCENNPVNRIDPAGSEWWHWLLGAAVVVGCAVATVVTCGSAAAAAAAVLTVGSGYTTATVTFGLEAVAAAAESENINDFAEKGNWGTVAVTAGSAFLNGLDGYCRSKSVEASQKAQVPQDAKETYDYVSKHNGATKPGYRGGRHYANDGRSGSAILPSEYAPFREYDIHPYTPGVNRGPERIVVGAGNGGAAWYTPNHYKTFMRLEK